MNIALRRYSLMTSLKGGSYRKSGIIYQYTLNSQWKKEGEGNKSFSKKTSNIINERPLMFLSLA